MKTLKETLQQMADALSGEVQQTLLVIRENEELKGFCSSEDITKYDEGRDGLPICITLGLVENTDMDIIRFTAIGNNLVEFCSC